MKALAGAIRVYFSAEPLFPGAHTIPRPRPEYVSPSEGLLRQLFIVDRAPQFLPGVVRSYVDEPLTAGEDNVPGGADEPASDSLHLLPLHPRREETHLEPDHQVVCQQRCRGTNPAQEVRFFPLRRNECFFNLRFLLRFFLSPIG